jgi:hypothetical protein
MRNQMPETDTDEILALKIDKSHSHEKAQLRLAKL